MHKGDQKFHTPLSKAKGHGASHSGVGHWWLQRVTAVALIPLLVWLVLSLLTQMVTSDVGIVATWFASPVNSLGTAALLIAMFWHMKLGMQVIVEDYVHAPFWKYTWLLLNNFLCFALPILGIMAILRMHMVDLTSFGA